MPARKVPDGLRLMSPKRVVEAARDTEVGGNGLDFADVPDVLDAEGVAEWRRLGQVFKAQPTRFREGDRAAVIAYAAWWSAFRRAAREVAERGPVVDGRTAADRGRLVKNPATVAMREAATQLRYWARELGLTPDARGRMGLTDDDKEETDFNNPFAWPITEAPLAPSAGVLPRDVAEFPH